MNYLKAAINLLAATDEEIMNVAESIGIDLDEVDFNQLKKGVEVELEHGKTDSETDVTGDDLEDTIKIAWAHLKELPDYYDKLSEMEKSADLQLDEVSEEDIIDWFEEHPNPDDEDVHAWAEELDIDPHELEEVIYSTLTKEMR